MHKEIKTVFFGQYLGIFNGNEFSMNNNKNQNEFDALIIDTFYA